MKITDLFAPLERLIEEHGSATIQAKHIAFLREQLSVLKERFVELESKLEGASAKCKELQTENSNLKQEIERLKTIGSRAGSWGSKPPIDGLR